MPWASTLYGGWSNMSTITARLGIGMRYKLVTFLKVQSCYLKMVQSVLKYHATHIWVPQMSFVCSRLCTTLYRRWILSPTSGLTSHCSKFSSKQA